MERPTWSFALPPTTLNPHYHLYPTRKACVRRCPKWIFRLNVLFPIVTFINSPRCMLYCSIELYGRLRHSSGASNALSSSSLFLQVCHLRNTSYMYLIVVVVVVYCSLAACVYTGNETKFGKNKNTPQMKLTAADRMINWFTVMIFVFQVGFPLISNL